MNSTQLAALVMLLLAVGTESMQVTCTRAGNNPNNLKLLAPLNSNTVQQTNEDAATTLKRVPSSGTQTSPSIWLYVAEAISCTITTPTGLNPATSVYSVAVTSHSLRRWQGNQLTLFSITNWQATIKDSSNREHRVPMGVNLITGSTFSIIYPCAELGLLRSKLTLDLRVTVVDGGTSVNMIHPIVAQYFYGYPDSMALSCPTDVDRVHAWSATDANAQNSPTTFGPTGSTIYQAEMLYCSITSRDVDGEIVIPDPNYNTNLEGTFAVTMTQELCPTTGCRISKGRPQQAGSTLVDIPFISNVIRNKEFPYTQLAWEPKDFARVLISVSLVDKRSFPAQTAITNIGGPLTSETTASCTPTTLDLSTPTIPVICTITPRANGIPTAAFTDDLFISDTSGGPATAELSKFITMKPLVKSASAAYKSWNSPTAPGFSFTLELEAIPQPADFDGKAIVLYVHWRKKSTAPADFPYDSCKRTIGTTEDLILFTNTIRVTIAYVPKPVVSLSCNDRICSEQKPAVIGHMHVGNTVTQNPLTIVPFISGSGTNTRAFGEGSINSCWTMDAQTTCFESTTAAWRATSTRGVLVIIGEPGTPLKPEGYLFKVKLTFSFSIMDAALSAEVTVAVRIFFNSFDTTGFTRITDSVSSTVESLPIYCQDFADVDPPYTAWLSSREVDVNGNDISSEKIATTIQENFELKSKSTAAQLTEIGFSHSFGGPKNSLKVVSTSTAVITQEGSSNPLSGNGEASNALDSNLDTEWIDYNKKSIIISFRNPAVIDQFTMTTGLSNPENDIMQWQLSGSYDGTSWSVLHSQTSNYPVPLGRKEQLPWFPLDVWKVYQNGGMCTGCRTIIPDDQTTISSEVECRWLCGRSKDCNFINFESTNKTCQILSCNSPPVAITANTYKCSSLAMEFRYLQFTPIRMRETPINFWPVSNGSTAINTYHRVTCFVRDAKGSVATASNSVTVTAAPLLPPLPTIASDAIANVRARQTDMASRETSLTLDEIEAQTATVQLLKNADGNSRLSFADYCLSVIEGRVAAEVSKDWVSPWQIERIIEIVKTLTELINVGIGYRDPTVVLTMRATSNTRITSILEKISDITNNVVLSTKSLSAASSVVSLLLDGIVHESAVLGVNLARQPRTLETDSAKLRVDSIMKIMCSLGVASLHEKPLDSCITCDSCVSAGGISMKSCLSTAFGIRGQIANPTTSVSGVFPIEYPAGQTPVSPQFIHSTSGRVPLSSHVGFIGFSLPKNPRLYDSDFFLLRGNVSNFCLVDVSQDHGRRSLITVAPTTVMSVTSPIVATNTAKQPLMMSRRGDTSWGTGPCSTATPVVGQTTITQFCNGSANGLPSEYAAVSEIMYSRCTPGDISGCIAVTNENKYFEDCTCTICSSASSTAAPNGYFRDPVANGKFCVPFQSFTCNTATQSYTAAISDQCKGGSILVGGACVCDTHKTCASGFCQGEGRCSRAGGQAECAASGLLFNESTLLCECPSTQYCESNAAVPTCVQNLDCTVNRTTEYSSACTGGSTRDPETRKCVCGNTEFCNTISKSCNLRAKCGTIPFQSEKKSMYCWPAELGQPKLVAADNYRPVGDYAGTIVPEQVYCQCPVNITCDGSIYGGTCTCPLCLNGGTCMYNTDTTEWVALGHACRCQEGFTGANCGIKEVKRSQFIFVTYPGGNFTAYDALSSSDKQLVMDSVNSTTATQAATSTVSMTNVLAVVIEAGSLIIRIELHVYPSSWGRGVSWRLQQAEFFNQISNGIQTTLGATKFATLGGLDGTAALVQQVVSVCAPIPNCLASASQWGEVQCQCLACVEGYFVINGACQSILSCNNLQNCNGRGIASLNEAKTVCECNCTTEFIGRQCETDLCLESNLVWTTNPNCGPLRCSQRIDDRKTAGSTIGSCVSDSGADLSGKDIFAMIMLLALCAFSSFHCAFYWIYNECVWDHSNDDAPKKTDDEDDEEEQLRPQEEHSPHLQPDDEPFGGSVMSAMDDTEDSLG